MKQVGMERTVKPRRIGTSTTNSDGDMTTPKLGLGIAISHDLT